jgi:hypothetical protein
MATGGVTSRQHSAPLGALCVCAPPTPCRFQMLGYYPGSTICKCDGLESNPDQLPLLGVACFRVDKLHFTAYFIVIWSN